MKAIWLAKVVALAATQALAEDTLTAEEVAKLPFMAAFAYAEAIDAYCLPEWHYASTALAAAAITQADLQNKSHVSAEQTLEASRLKADRSACEPAMAFVDDVTATIPEMQPKMDATLTVLENERAQRDAAEARTERIAQCDHLVATVKAFLEAKWSLSNSGYEEELTRCVADLAAMPEAGSAVDEAKALLPQVTERIKLQSPKDRTTSEQGEVDPKSIIADWCAKQTEKTALCAARGD
jgi:hypothetical protein